MKSRGKILVTCRWCSSSVVAALLIKQGYDVAALL